MEIYRVLLAAGCLIVGAIAIVGLVRGRVDNDPDLRRMLERDITKNRIESDK